MASQLDVAKLAKVSFMTVSRVVNGDPKVKEETRIRVQKAIETLNYYPNAAARALNSQKTMTIGLILPEFEYVLSEPYFSQLIYCIEKALSPYNYDLLIGSAEHQNGRDLTLLHRQKKVDGLIIVGSAINDERLDGLSKHRIPAVLIHGRSDLPFLSYVDVNNIEIIEYFVNYLYDLGHRKIGIITGDMSVINACHRLTGYKQALSSKGIPYKEEFKYVGNWSSRSGYNAFFYFKELEDGPTAIIASNDHMAVGFLKAAHEHGVRVPDDLSLVGIDDIEMASFTIPMITTMKQPIDDIALKAVEALLKSITSEEPLEEHIILDAEPVIRDSCRRIS
jgi:LacI family transcriptional regulator